MKITSIWDFFTFLADLAYCASCVSCHVRRDQPFHARHVQVWAHAKCKKSWLDTNFGYSFSYSYYSLVFPIFLYLWEGSKDTWNSTNTQRARIQKKSIYLIFFLVQTKNLSVTTLMQNKKNHKSYPRPNSPFYLNHFFYKYVIE